MNLVDMYNYSYNNPFRMMGMQYFHLKCELHFLFISINTLAFI